MSKSTRPKKPARPKKLAEDVYLLSAGLLAADDADTDVLQWGLFQEARGDDPGPIDLGRNTGGLTAVEKAVLAGIDWVQLAFLLESVAADESLKGSPEVIEFTQYVASLARKYGPSWGADGVFEAITRAFTARARKDHESAGEATRESVRDAWRQLEKKGVPERARAKQIAQDEMLSLRQVQAVIASLQLRTKKP